MRKTLTCLAALLMLFCLAVSASPVPALEIESSLQGSAYTNGKSTLKYHLNTSVSYEGEAVLTLVLSDGSAVDDSKIDITKASVALVPGDGYYPDEYIFLKTSLDGEWENGSCSYTLQEGDLELDLSKYPLLDLDSGREWSCLGGDGHGNYSFNLEVSGIVYDGTEVESKTFRLPVSIYGYDYTGDAVSLYGSEGTPLTEPVFSSLEEKTGEKKEASSEPIFTWVGAGELPILCDSLEDDFYITWPEGAEASSDVTLTLTGKYGDSLTLTPGKDYFVSSSGSETQIALTYQNWAFTPVYSKLLIDAGGASAVYDIASVYVYEAQQGGGGKTVDGTVTAYSFYGLKNLESWEQLIGTPAYLLQCRINGIVYYYAEKDGEAYLTDKATEGVLFEAVEERDPQLHGNTLYITTRLDLKQVEKEVAGMTVLFQQYYPGWDFPLPAGSLLNPTLCDPSLEAEEGYVIPWGTSNWITNEKWAWQKGIEEGWRTIEVSPYQGKFEWKVAKGGTEQFTPAREVESWEIFGDVSVGTYVTQDGLLTVSPVESHPSFAVTVTDKDGNYGTVTINVQ